jgi:spoIIIJ-associated protein
MTFREFTGKNVEEAIRAAMAEFSADLGDLDIEILSQGKRGMLGVGGEEARILAAPKSAVDSAETVRVEAQPAEAGEEASAGAEPTGSVAEPETGDDVAAPDLAAEPSEQLADLDRAAASARRPRGGRTRGGRGRGRNGADREYAGVRESREGAPRAARSDRGDRGDRGREPAPFVPGKPVEELSDEERATLETAKEVLDEMIRLMGLAATVEISSTGETSRLNVKGDDLGALIGRRGEKLASLQHIVNLIVGRREGQHHRIAIDVENYRGRREEQLRDVADRAAKRVAQTGKIIQLEAMPAVERRIVHMALVENPKVRTQSVGVEPNRRIVVLPASQVKE